MDRSIVIVQGGTEMSNEGPVVLAVSCLQHVADRYLHRVRSKDAQDS